MDLNIVLGFEKECSSLEESHVAGRLKERSEHINILNFLFETSYNHSDVNCQLRIRICS